MSCLYPDVFARLVWYEFSVDYMVEQPVGVNLAHNNPVADKEEVQWKIHDFSSRFVMQFKSGFRGVSPALLGA